MHRIFGKQSRKGLMMVAAGVFAATAFASVTAAAPAKVEARKAAMAVCGNFSGQMASTCKQSQMDDLRAQAAIINADFNTCLAAGNTRSYCNDERDAAWSAWMAGV